MNDIFVLTNQKTTEVLDTYPHARRIEGTKLTKKIVTEMAKKAKTKSFYIVRDDPDLVSSFRFQYDVEDSSGKINVWNERIEVCLLDKQAVLDNPDRYTDILEKYETDDFTYRWEDIYKPDNFQIFSSLEEGLQNSKYFYFYVAELNNTVKSKIKVPELYHRFRRYQSKDGLTLVPKVMDKHVEEIDEECVNVLSQYDVFFLCYDEPNAIDNFNMLQKKVNHVQMISGVKGIHNAHVAAASRARTSMFYVVDADARILDSFDFSKTMEDEKSVYVWRSINIINCLTYGYGGVKLFPTLNVRGYQGNGVDFTTSVSDWFRPINEISNITSFNTNGFNSFRSGFREACKLASSIIERQVESESLNRLDAWCTVGADQPFGKECIAGAQRGRIFGRDNKHNPEALAKINDYEWLKEQYRDYQNDIIDRS